MSAPETDTPTRDTTFADTEDQSKYADQEAPPRENEDGTNTDGEKIKPATDETKPTTDDTKPVPAKSSTNKVSATTDATTDTKTDTKTVDPYKPEEATDGTTYKEGYGLPTKGEYSITTKGYKTFGTTGQGTSTAGAKTETASECASRQMYITVTALDAIDTSKEDMKLELVNGAFANIVYEAKVVAPIATDADETNAVLLKGSIATILLAYLSFN